MIPTIEPIIISFYLLLLVIGSCVVIGFAYLFYLSLKEDI